MHPLIPVEEDNRECTVEQIYTGQWLRWGYNSGHDRTRQAVTGGGGVAEQHDRVLPQKKESLVEVVECSHTRLNEDLFRSFSSG